MDINKGATHTFVVCSCMWRWLIYNLGCFNLTVCTNNTVSSRLVVSFGVATGNMTR